jgi:hypothetical protein
MPVGLRSSVFASQSCRSRRRIDLPAPPLEEYVEREYDGSAAVDLQHRAHTLNQVELLIAGRCPEVEALVIRC